jgi:hypothetical protein
MSRARFYNPQFDLFLPTIVDLRFRDQKDTMERPFFSLSKSKRMKPITRSVRLMKNSALASAFASES